MFLIMISRIDLLRLLPPGGVVGEIGTAEGDYAAEILAKARPSKLHLIDPWEHQAREDYARDATNVDDAQFAIRHDGVLARFAEPIATGQVVIHRAYSPAAAALFPDEYFDYVYIDGMHTEQATSADLRGFDRKVKKGGLILGHDYATHPGARAMGFGVVEAVNRFIGETGYEFCCLTYEGSPSYVIAKDPASPMRNYLLGNIMRSVPGIVEIENAERRELTQKNVVGADGKPVRMILGYR